MSANNRLLRGFIRKSIRLKGTKGIDKFIEETKLRTALQDLILEVAAEEPESDPHEYTGINFLRQLFKNTNVLKTLRQAYKTLTTNDEQRTSFRAHIVAWMINTLAPVEATDKATLTEVEDVNLDVTDDDREKFIDADDGTPDDPDEEEAPKDEDELEQIPDEDTTGRNAAERVYPTIETSIVDFFSSLDDVKDQEIFRKWLIANIKLYFDKWEDELNTRVEEPGSEEYDQAVEDAGLGGPEALQPTPPAGETGVGGLSIADMGDIEQALQEQKKKRRVL